MQKTVLLLMAALALSACGTPGERAPASAAPFGKSYDQDRLESWAQSCRQARALALAGCASNGFQVEQARHPQQVFRFGKSPAQHRFESWARTCAQVHTSGIAECAFRELDREPVR